jgi:hypothetical protein
MMMKMRKKSRSKKLMMIMKIIKMKMDLMINKPRMMKMIMTIASKKITMNNLIIIKNNKLRWMRLNIYLF